MTTANTNISNLQQKTNVLSYDASNNIITLNAKLTVSSDEFANGNLQIGDGNGTDTLTLKANISAE